MRLVGGDVRQYGGGDAAVLAEQDLNGYIQPTKFENIDIIVADVSMGTLDMALFTKISRENIVRSILRPVVERGYYDYILIDTNPNLSLLNFNIVNASNYVLIPAQTTMGCSRSLARMLSISSSSLSSGSGA